MNLISVAVEILQYLFKVGATDIDDIILNGLGGFLGIVIYKILCKIFKDKVKYAIGFISIIAGITFLILSICFSSGVFGIKIRIL
ncbi:VanZ family protein [Lysinibacillus parviboronicapiens]|uniref:VanZ family protein n=1 Tax=Lysinibacillus parviboronicapiens TaxID=436516 RepID=UPI0006D1A095|nr:VanZ family protein [Lysinibacillus parviboronicapiens]